MTGIGFRMSLTQQFNDITKDLVFFFSFHLSMPTPEAVIVVKDGKRERIRLTDLGQLDPPLEG